MKISNFFIILKCSFLLRKNIYIYKETGVLGETNLDINCTVMISIMMIIFFYQKTLTFLIIRKNVNIPKKVSEVCGLSGSIARPPLSPSRDLPMNY